MATVSQLVLEIQAKDQASKILADVQKQTGGLGKTLQDVGKIAGGFLAANVVAGGVQKLTGFINDSIGAARESITVNAQLDAVLKSTGGAAGITAKQVQDMGARLEKMTLFEDEAIISSSNLLLTFTNIGKDIFPQAQQAVLDMSQALGQDLSSSSIQLGKALNDPIGGITALSRVGVSFTEEQKKVIKKMVETGDTAGAQALILQELSREFGGSAQAASDAAGMQEKLKDKMNELKEQIGTKMLPIQAALTTAQLILVTFLAEKLIPTLEALYKQHWPAISKVLTDVATIVTGTLWPAFQSGLDTVFPLVRDFTNFIINNEAVLIAAILAVGAAIVLSLGPVSGAALAIGGIITLIGIMKEDWEAAKRFMEGGPIKAKVEVFGVNLGGGPGTNQQLDAILDKILPFRASGGPVERGKPYIVGEEGPELFTPRQSGAIIPMPSPSLASIMPSSQMASRSMELHVHLEGPVYGWNDFEHKVAEAVRNVKLRGGFYGVIA